MSRAPAVSILTPTYRHAAFIESTIASVQAQTFEDWEMLVLDDGSDDGTADLAEAIGDPRVRVFREPHRGIERLEETYNCGLAEARGELIAILEGDDLWPPDKLAIQVPDFSEPEVVLSAGKMEIRVGEETVAISPAVLPLDDVLNNRPVGQAAVAMMRPRVLTFAFPVTVLMRRSALESVGGFQRPADLPLVDYPTFLQMARAGEWRFHHEVLGIWRRHEGSVTKSRFSAILHGAHRYAAAFAKEHGKGVGLTAEDRDVLNREWRDMQIDRLVLLGRWNAAQGSRRRAAAAFRRALAFAPGRNTRLMLSSASLLCSLGLSPEPAMRIGRRGDWKEELRSFGVDPFVNLDDDPAGFERLDF